MFIADLENEIYILRLKHIVIRNQKLSAVLRELPLGVTNAFEDNYVLEFLAYRRHKIKGTLYKPIRQMKAFIQELPQVL